MSSALFGSAARASSKNLVEFRAGKMHMKGKMVHPDKRKGLVYLYQSDDSLMHYCWKDRTTGSVEEDLIIFPDDCEYKRVTACTSGRVYVLKFRSTTRRLFFWMQEPKTDKDDEICRKINDLLNNPPAPGSHSTPSRSGGSSGTTAGSGSGGSGGSSAASAMLGGELSGIRDSDLQNLIGNISQQQLMQILGSGVPSLSSLLGPNSTSSGRSSTTATPTNASTPSSVSTPVSASPPPLSSTTTSTSMDTSTTSSATASSKKDPPIKLSDLQNILSGMMPEGGGSSGVDLSPAMTAEALQPILTNAEFVKQLKPFLPSTAEPLPPAEQLRGTVTSPQFKQAVSLFSAALESGQLGPLVKQFGLGDDAVLAAAAADMEGFVKALSKKKEKSDKDNKDDDDSMAVD